MRRVVVAEVPTGGADTPLDSDAAHYVERVLRLRDGDCVELLDGSGRTVRATLRWRDGQAWATALHEFTDNDGGPDTIVVAALLKAARWEWLVEKCAELGATRIIPVAADRSVVRIASNREAAKVERWSRIAAAAARQSGRAVAPTIDAPASLNAAIARAREAGAALVRIDFGGSPLALDTASGGPVAFFVGPEGGFTDAERRALDEAKAVVASLGDAVLRAETASIAALVAIGVARARP